MRKPTLALFIFLFFKLQANAQLGVMKLVGNNTKDYSIGFGAFIKTGFPVSDGAALTVELGANIFPVKGSGFNYGTVMCPLKAGYRYTLNKTGDGFYVEPQAGFNVYGVTSLAGENGETINLKYHGVVLAAGGGYLFNMGNTPFDVNLRYETVIAHGGSNNLISLGITKFFSFGSRNVN
ncbi:MAG TPA: hypothetical protein VGB71_13515 [Flavisolibacter sp.]|jgi:hypothetical protein